RTGCLAGGGAGWWRGGRRGDDRGALRGVLAGRRRGARTRREARDALCVCEPRHPQVVPPGHEAAAAVPPRGGRGLTPTRAGPPARDPARRLVDQRLSAAATLRAWLRWSIACRRKKTA